jgi:hypothetical protein
MVTGTGESPAPLRRLDLLPRPLGRLLAGSRRRWRSARTRRSSSGCNRTPAAVALVVLPTSPPTVWLWTRRATLSGSPRAGGTGGPVSSTDGGPPGDAILARSGSPRQRRIAGPWS